MTSPVESSGLDNLTFRFRDGLKWQIEVPVSTLEKHMYDRGDPYGGFLHRCEYTSYADLVEREVTEVLSYIQAHCSINLCIHVASLVNFDLPRDAMLVCKGAYVVLPLSFFAKLVSDVYYAALDRFKMYPDLRTGLCNKMMDAIASSCHTLQWFLEVLQYNATGQSPKWAPEHCQNATLIYLSGLIIGEQLEGLYTALVSAQERRNPRDWPDASQMMWNTLITRGYCPREIQTFMKMRFTASTIATLCYTLRICSTQDHSDCTLDFCPYETVDEKDLRATAYSRLRWLRRCCY